MSDSPTDAGAGTAPDDRQGAPGTGPTVPHQPPAGQPYPGSAAGAPGPDTGAPGPDTGAPGPDAGAPGSAVGAPVPGTPTGSAAPPARRRFPWVPVLAGLAALQLAGAGVLLALLIGSGAQLVRLNDTVAEQEATIAELEASIDGLASERDEARQQLSSAQAGFETALDFATAYEACLVPLFGAYDAWDAEQVARGDDLFEQAWGSDGPCWEAEAYLRD